MIQIEPPIRVNFEFKTIIWETRNCVFKDELEKFNDVFCKGGSTKSKPKKLIPFGGAGAKDHLIEDEIENCLSHESR
jgi:hypothetical protein